MTIQGNTKLIINFYRWFFNNNVNDDFNLLIQQKIKIIILIKKKEIIKITKKK